ncbi:MAG: NYN domain-containing protein [Acidobacteria bacterium]|nr:NYN domain-containing protein [Acidobacteriota bacterium]
MRVNPWWRRPAAEEKAGPAGSETASPETEDEPRHEAAAEAEPTEDSEPAEDAAVEETAASEPAAEPRVSAALEAATEPAEPARPATGDDGEAAPPKRRRRRRRSRRRGRGGGPQQGGEAGQGAEAQAPAAAPRKTKSGGPGRAAVLLDLGGLERSLEGGPALDAEGLLARLDGELGKLVLRRVYADASEERLDRKALHGGGAEVVDVPSGTEVRGCSAAVRIVVDALELCYTKRSVDTVVLVATSVQMLPLVAKLQMNGLTVIGLGGSEGDAQVRAQCDRFIDLGA